jgi:hypothetical protein
MTKELQQTPTPIPEEFMKSAKAEAGQYEQWRPGLFLIGAEWAYRLLSSQGLRWVKVSEMLPPEDKLVFCRTTRGRKIVTSAAKGEWDNYWLDEDEESVIEWLLDESHAPIQ